MELSADGKFIFLLADGKPMKVVTENGKSESLKTDGEMELLTSPLHRLHCRHKKTT